MADLRHHLETLADDCIKEFGTANIHQILGVSHDANLDQLKEAIRQFLRRCHPDKAGTGATAKTQVVNRFTQVFKDARWYLSYVLMNKVRYSYLTQPVVDQYKMQIYQLQAQLQQLKVEETRLRSELEARNVALENRDSFVVRYEIENLHLKSENEQLRGENQRLKRELALQRVTIDEQAAILKANRLDFDSMNCELRIKSDQLKKMTQLYSAKCKEVAKQNEEINRINHCMATGQNLDLDLILLKVSYEDLQKKMNELQSKKSSTQ